MNNQQEIDKYLDDLITQRENRVVKLYAMRYKEIKAEIAKMYEMYEEDGVLTMAQMSKYNRLDKSLGNIIELLLDVQTEAYKLAQKSMEEQFIENYYRSAYLYEYEAQQKLGFGLLSQDVVVAATVNPIDKLTLPAVRERNRKIIVDRIRTEIEQGLLRGDSYAAMSKKVKEAVAFDAHKAKTVVRTESHRVQTEGRMKSADQASKYVVMQKMWDATLDSGTRKAHQKLDGQVIGKDENFRSPAGGKGKAPGHMHNAGDDINCRCTVIFVVNGRKPEVKRARNEDGSTTVIPYTSYEDWYKNRIK